MKLKFKHQEFQTNAVHAVVDLFKGQPRQQDTFTITNEKQLSLDAGMGFNNVLTLDSDRIVTNMQEVQRRFSLPITEDDSRHFCVEMETGTGKTYVYTKTIFELNKQYGFTKFIVVVPSVAIREGVHKSFQITADHFARDYDEVAVRCFIYSSKGLSDVRAFATSSEIEIMIINIDAFKKSENIFNQSHERLSGAAAISMIQDTNPIVIIDEPQSVDNTPKAKEAIASLNPLAVLRYSATHREKINTLYRLTPVDAYNEGLVKQICVSSNELDSDYNRPYIRLNAVTHENGYSAKLEIDRRDPKSGKVTRKVITAKPGADLFAMSGNRDLYEGYQIVGIDCTQGLECIEFTDGTFLKLGKAIGERDENLIKRAQIRRTIEAHLEKELRYTHMRIKVLSLFFIDEVAKYRTAEGEKGIYAIMFEECYEELMSLQKFAPLREQFKSPMTSIHDGYFSQDKKGVLKNTRGDTADDYDTYTTIMKDKEWLLSFDCPLRFIFSHSTLKEGWDNPNVFQVCTLIEQKSTFTARQKVGRGLRLCVNQDGDRVEDRNINILHVMANESFAEFADTLQREIEQETGVKFGVLQLNLFSGMTYKQTVTEEKTVSPEEAKVIADYVQQLVQAKTAPPQSAPEKEEATAPSTEPAVVTLPPAPTPPVPPALASVIEKAVAAAQMGATVTPEKVATLTYTQTTEVEKTISHDEAQGIISHFETKGYISKSGVIQQTMKADLAAGTLDVPEQYREAVHRFETIVSKANSKIPVRNKGNEVIVRLKKQVLASPEFLAIWDRIKGRTTYRIAMDEATLRANCADAVANMEPVPKARVVTRTAQVHVLQSGITHTETGAARAEDILGDAHKLPDFMRMVDDECGLAPQTIADILFRSGRIQDLLANPQKFTEMFIETLKTIQYGMEIDGIRYSRLEGQEHFFLEVFENKELIAYLENNAIAVDNSVYDHIVYDSDTVELPFAKALDDDPDVRLFFKIPPRFTIETPIGTYNPDWAVYMDKDGEEKLYFVIETKGTNTLYGLRDGERDKIKCGARHFAALGSDVHFPERPVRDWREFRLGAAQLQLN